MRVLVPLGTRPEIVKLAPVVTALRERGLDVRTLATGQHHDPSLTEVFFDRLGLVPDDRWQLEGDEADRLGTMLTLAHRELQAQRPDLVLVLGDTYTVPLFCLAARYQRVPIAHAEAGLRSLNETSSEEVNRRVAAPCASLHFAPTSLAARFLLDEGVPTERVRIVGNPVIDALRQRGAARRPPRERAGVVITAHRATNVDDPLRLDALVRLVVRLAEELGPVTFPIHPRTVARLDEARAGPSLAAAGVRLVPPLQYDEMLSLVSRSRVVVTDSGGLQEEASWLGVPVVVLRHSTPRWESVAAGMSVLAGLDLDLALAASRRFASDEEQDRVSGLPCPYGDGRAGERIASILADPATSSLLRLDVPDYRGRRAPGTIEAVLFDLDDTLYPQQRWLDGAWSAVAMVAARDGLDPGGFRRALAAIADEDSAGGRIIDRALARVGAAHLPVAPLVAAFRSFRPRALPTYPGVTEALESLRARVPIGLVSDGDPAIQRAKLEALKLCDAFDVVVLSDELGRECRKPNRAPFDVALAKLGVEPRHAAYIGDSPFKDVAGATWAGLRVVRVRTGEYADRADGAGRWQIAPGVVEAIEMLQPMIVLPKEPRSPDHEHGNRSDGDARSEALPSELSAQPRPTASDFARGRG
jgi:UDP-N-acetylglucosamine 2-epimerase (non-hydrolysing)